MPNNVTRSVGRVETCTGSNKGLFFDLQADRPGVCVTHLEIPMGWKSGTVRVYAYDRGWTENPNEGRPGCYKDGRDGPLAWRPVSEPIRIKVAGRKPFGGPGRLHRIELSMKGGVTLPEGEVRGFCIHSVDGHVAFSKAGAADVTATDKVVTVLRGDWTCLGGITADLVRNDAPRSPPTYTALTGRGKGKGEGPQPNWSAFHWLYTKDAMKNDKRAFCGRVIYTCPDSDDLPEEGKLVDTLKTGDTVYPSPVSWLRRPQSALGEDKRGRIVQHCPDHVAPYKVDCGGTTSWYAEQHISPHRDRTA